MPETQNTSRFSRALTTVFWTAPATILSYLTGQGHRSQSSEQEPQNLGPCRFRLDTATSSKLTLPDGRDLGYAEYGSPTGKPIFCLHGTPGSRIELSFWHHHAERLGLRLIGLDRPGMGWSSPQPGRRVADHAKDVQFLAEYLGLEEYGVMGVSGGGPYALACACHLPTDKLKVVSLVCALGPPDIGYWGMFFINYMGWTWVIPYFPSFVRFWMSRQPEGNVHLPDEERFRVWQRAIKNSTPNPKDAPWWGDVDILRLAVRTTGEAFAQGMEGHAEDARTESTDRTSYCIDDIPKRNKDLPVCLWYGTEDGNVPMNHGVQIAKRVGSQARLHIKEETHMSISQKHMGDIFEEMAEFL